jgi:hypothetical protein
VASEIMNPVSFKLLESCEAGIEGGDQFVDVIGRGD